MDVNERKSQLGVKTVLEYLKRNGYECTDVSHSRKHKGYDILARKKGKKIRIEVKCSTKTGIPDCFGSEFNRKLKVDKANFFYIVRVNKKLKPVKIDILTKKEINYYKHKRKPIIKLSSELKRDLRNGKVGKIVGL